MKAQFVDDEGNLVDGCLMVNGIPVDEQLMARSPFYKELTAAEWDLIARYDRGELL
jgi:hypothetical protein